MMVIARFYMTASACTGSIEGTPLTCGIGMYCTKLQDSMLVMHPDKVYGTEDKCKQG